MAKNCIVESTTKLSGEVGIIAMEDNVGEDIEGGVRIGIEVGVDEQDVMAMVKATISPTVRQ
jgi:hypothetical protein